jgi:triosephosphate isomerase (TIM)
MSRKPFVIGNWKMNTNRGEAIELARAVAMGVPANVDVAICPPFPWLISVKDVLADSAVRLGAQNCWNEPSGAFTGEVSPSMVAEICQFVIVGHSERRRILGESDELVASKVRAALASSLSIILCVGEDIKTRRAGGATAFVQAQLQSALGELGLDLIQRCTVAYEPIWAIGTGVAAEPADAQQMTAAIRSAIGQINPELGDNTRILYGGSVSKENALAILSQPDVDGALCGGASLKADSFRSIIQAASRCA